MNGMYGLFLVASNSWGPLFRPKFEHFDVGRLCMKGTRANLTFLQVLFRARKTCVAFWPPVAVNIGSVAEKSDMTIPESSEMRCCSQFRNPHKCAARLVSGIAGQRIPELQQVRCCSQFRNRQNEEFLNLLASRWQKKAPSRGRGQG